MNYQPSAEDWQRALPPAVYALVALSVPVGTRLLVAQGKEFLPPRELIYGLSFLSVDTSTELASAARAALSRTPEAVLLPILLGDSPSVVLWAMLPMLAERPVLLEALLGNPHTPDAALAQWAPHAPGRLAELLAQDVVRCLRCEALVGGLAQNPSLPKSSLDRLLETLMRAGVIPDVAASADVLAKLSPQELQMAAAKIALPDLAEPLLDGSGDADKAAASAAAPAQNEVLKASVEADAQAQKPMLKLVAELNMAQKIALATKGNKEARSILLRDANRIVAVAAIRNPRITEQEVQTAAKSRSVNDEVIRIIANSKDMTRSYGTKLALVNNPKVPLSIALRFLSSLRGVDLKAVANSKGLPQTLVAQAKKLVQSADTGG